MGVRRVTLLLPLLLLATAQLLTSNPELSGNNDLKDDVRRILSRRGHKDDPGVGERLLSYSKSSRETRNELERVLVELAEEECREQTVVCKTAIHALGELGVSAALGTLEPISRSRVTSLRITAVRAIGKIGGAEMLEFAHEIVANLDTYDNFDRRILYRTLIENSADPPNITWEESQELVQSFLLEAVYHEMHAGNVVLLDGILQDENETYRLSYEREDVLERFQATLVDDYRQYFREELRLLRSSPHEQRTHIEVKKN